jgi:hypothetical protein
MTSTERSVQGNPDGGPMVAGKVVIVAIVIFAVGASIVSWIYYARLQQRPLALWGSRPAELMLRAPTARAYRLVPATDAPGQDNASGAQEFAVAGERFIAADEHDVSHAPGFSHIRQSLIHDRSFVWDEAVSERQSRWEYAIAFSGASDTATVAFAFDSGRASLVGTDRIASIRPVAAAIENFLREQFPAEEAAAAKQ